MPKYIVEVSFTQTKAITESADTEEEAEDKAISVVMKWANAADAEAMDCEEERAE